MLILREIVESKHTRACLTTKDWFQLKDKEGVKLDWLRLIQTKLKEATVRLIRQTIEKQEKYIGEVRIGQIASNRWIKETGTEKISKYIQGEGHKDCEELYFTNTRKTIVIVSKKVLVFIVFEYRNQGLRRLPKTCWKKTKFVRKSQSC